jgi:hypothetical protein
MLKLPQFLVQSQHPPTQWNLRGADEVGLNKKNPLEKKNNSVPYLIVGSREEQHLAVLAQVLVNPGKTNYKIITTDEKKN